jgi:DNA polymerase I
MSSDPVLDLPYAEIWCVDFEYNEHEIVCLAAQEYRSGRRILRWNDELGETPPYNIGDDALFVCYAANAELGAHLRLGWPLPRHVLDLNAEFRVVANGRRRMDPEGKEKVRWRLIDALKHYRLDAIGALEKESMRKRVLQGGPWSANDRSGILKYCFSDVASLVKLLPRVSADAAKLPYQQPGVYLRHAEFRGRFMCANASIECRGIPVDMEIYPLLSEHWDGIIHRVIQEEDKYGVYDENDEFKEQVFSELVDQWGISWPRLKSGRVELKKTTFSDVAKLDSRIKDIHELRKTRAMLRSTKLKVGNDGRARTMLWAFGAKTGRTQPSASEYIFSPAKWMRSLAKPGPGRALAYLDWSAEEFGIAAWLSKDENMLKSYAAGDPHTALARQAGAITDATPTDHRKKIRSSYKAVNFGSMYGMGTRTLAFRIGQSIWAARALHNAHRMIFRRYAAWSDAVINEAARTGHIHTPFGWWFHIGGTVPRRTLKNWPMQATGGDLLRVACVLGEKYGVKIIATVHDAVLIEAAIEDIERDVALMKEIMKRASRIVLGGFEVRVGDAEGTVDIVRWPDRFVDEDGQEMWGRVMRLLAAVTEGAAA